MQTPRRALMLGTVVACLLAGCAARDGTASLPQAPSSGAFASPASRHIKHIVIVVQENRSFDNLFAGFPGADAPLSGRDGSGALVPLRTIGWQGPDIGHSWADAMDAWDNGKMDGFEKELGGSDAPAGTYPYARLDRKLIMPYWQMARRYVLADHMFATEFGGSFTAHLDLIAGTTNLSPTEAEVNWPPAQIWGCDSPPGMWSSLVNQQRLIDYTGGPFPCFRQFATLAGTLDAARVSWNYYAVAIGDAGDGWSAFDAIHDVRLGRDWKKVISPPSNVLTDIANGRLASVVWVTPDVRDSDHPGGDSGTGPSWVASVVNAIGRSRYWKSTAVVVLWDDWGGWYDDAPPPQRDFVGNGMRVPCIIISPYARTSYVSHTYYEFGSIIKFVEETFGLPPLGAPSFGYTDARAASLTDSFNFSQSPRTFRKIDASYDASYFLHRVPSHEAPDTQ